MNKYFYTVTDYKETHNEGCKLPENVRVNILSFHGWDLSWKGPYFLPNTPSYSDRGYLPITIVRLGHFNAAFTLFPVCNYCTSAHYLPSTKTLVFHHQRHTKFVKVICFWLGRVWLLVSWTKAWQELFLWVWAVDWYLYLYRIRSGEEPVVRRAGIFIFFMCHVFVGCLLILFLILAIFDWMFLDQSGQELPPLLDARSKTPSPLPAYNL